MWKKDIKSFISNVIPVYLELPKSLFFSKPHPSQATEKVTAGSAKPPWQFIYLSAAAIPPGA
jgi:hypothetical protein